MPQYIYDETFECHQHCNTLQILGYLGSLRSIGRNSSKITDAILKLNKNSFNFQNNVIK